MEEKKYLDLLAKRDIQPTAIRILVLRTMMQAGRSVSLLDQRQMCIRDSPGIAHHDAGRPFRLIARP